MSSIKVSLKGNWSQTSIKIEGKRSMKSSVAVVVMVVVVLVMMVVVVVRDGGGCCDGDVGGRGGQGEGP